MDAVVIAALGELHVQLAQERGIVFPQIDLI